MTTGAWADVLTRLSGDGPIYVAGCCGEPSAFLDAMEADSDIARGRSFTGVWIPGVNRRDLTATGDRRALTSFVTPALAEAVATGRAEVLPMHYSATYRWLESRAGLSGAIFQVAPPEDGSVSLGVSADFTPAAISAGVPLIAQVNPAMPIATDGPRVPLDRFSAVIESASPLIQYDAGPSNQTYETIGQRVAGLIRDGDTVQFGLGKLQNAVLGALSGHRDLTLHGGMISPAFLDRLHDGTFARATVGVALGNSTFYETVSGDPRIAFKPVSHTHDCSVLARMRSFVSVNSILEIDLFGQGNGEFLGKTQITGHGGLVDFMRGANLSAEGQSILALPATAGRGAQSRIVPVLTAGTPVTVSRADVDWVVTEFGAAHLRDASVEQRAKRLIDIAAPQFRDSLGQAWDNARRQEGTE